jgi:hypothetical protein
MENYMKNPFYAAMFAGAMTAGGVYFTKGANLKNSEYTKPALFVALLVYFIVYYGNGQYETISKEPF